MHDVYIYDAIRAPRAKAKADGGLSDLTPHALLKQLYAALLNRVDIPADQLHEFVNEVILGCVTQQGEQAGNVAKSSLLYAGLPYQIAGTTVTRYCSSGLDAINLAALKIAGGQAGGMIAGGVEMMSRHPMLSDGARIFSDPKFAIACQILMMGSGADLIASLNNITRAQSDHIAFTSQQRAEHARVSGYNKSIIAIENPVKKITVSEDECIRANTTEATLSEMKPAFADLGAKGVDSYQLAAKPQLSKIDHIHTAGNSPAMADFAALVLLGNKALGEAIGQKPRAKIVAAAVIDDDPLQVLGGCISATEKLLRDNNLTASDIDLFEIHEAFAATMVKAQSVLNIPSDKLNVNGGVIALGHPMGATGSIMMGVLIDELERRDCKRGVVATSGAAGSGTALLVERV
jgi:acetyl-CoA C-acetyltransferase